jgi:hypothetical protein
MSALASFDSNQDGQITAADTNWNTLKVWQDANHNATVDAGELKTLAQLGITQLSLGWTISIGAATSGNPVTSLSSFTMNNQSHTMADVNLIHDNASHTLTTSGVARLTQRSTKTVMGQPKRQRRISNLPAQAKL